MAPCAFDTLFTKHMPHIPEKIFFYLDYQSFKACLEVSNVWKELLTSKSYIKKGQYVFHREILKDEILLYSASGNGYHNEVKKLLTTRMVNLSRQSFMGPAANKGHKEVVQLLLENGADPNIRNIFGYTSLHRAIFGGKKDVVKLLLQRGAELFPTVKQDPARAEPYKTEQGYAAVGHAAGMGRTDIFKLLIDFGQISLFSAVNDEQVLIMLLNAGADPNVVGRNGVTPLHMAALWGHIGITKLLLERGALPNLASFYGETPLLCAVINGFEEVIKLLLDGGADPNITNIMRDTPLIQAVLRGKENLVKLLMERGADRNMADERGNTALSFARAKGYQGIVNILTNQG